MYIVPDRNLNTGRSQMIYQMQYTVLNRSLVLFIKNLWLTVTSHLITKFLQNSYLNIPSYYLHIKIIAQNWAII